MTLWRWRRPILAPHPLHRPVRAPACPAARIRRGRGPGAARGFCPSPSLGAVLRLGRTRTRVRDFSLNTLLRWMPCAVRALSCESSSWSRVGQRAWPMRMSAPGVSWTPASGAGCRAATAVRCPVGRGWHPQRLREPGHVLVDRPVGGRRRPHRRVSCRAIRLDAAAGGGLALDVVRVARRGVVRVRHGPELSHTASLGTGFTLLLSENGF